MKKNILILLFFSLITFSFTNSPQWTDWGNWNSNNCFSKIDFRVKSNKTSTGKYEMYVEFKNDYSQDVHFNYEAKGGTYTTKNNRVTVRAGSTYKTYAGASFTSEYFYINIDKLRFGKDGLQEYANCQ